MLWTLTYRRQERCHSSWQWGVLAVEKGPTGCEQCSTCCTLPVIAILLRLWGHFMFLLSESTLEPENAVPDDMSSKLKWQKETWQRCVTTVASDFHFHRHNPTKKPDQALCFSFLRSWCILIERPLHYASSACGIVRKTNKLRIKYQTITTLFCFMVKQILFRPTNSLKHFVLTTLRKMKSLLLMKHTHLEKCGCGFV